jgi:dephospho-CoA kinase
VALDIPLLLESGSADQVDLVVVVSADAATQHARALDRPGMTEARLAFVLGRQMPDAVKRRRADVVIKTSGSLADTRSQVAALLSTLAATDHDVRLFRQAWRVTREGRAAGAGGTDHA